MRREKKKKRNNSKNKKTRKTGEWENGKAGKRENKKREIEKKREEKKRKKEKKKKEKRKENKRIREFWRWKHLLAHLRRCLACFARAVSLRWRSTRFARVLSRQNEKTRELTTWLIVCRPFFNHYSRRQQFVKWIVQSSKKLIYTTVLILYLLWTPAHGTHMQLPPSQPTERREHGECAYRLFLTGLLLAILAKARKRHWFFSSSNPKERFHVSPTWKPKRAFFLQGFRWNLLHYWLLMCFQVGVYAATVKYNKIKHARKKFISSLLATITLNLRLEHLILHLFSQVI